MNTDVVIIGAGPVGLWQAFQLGLQGVDCVLIDALDHAGGQCAEIYPDKPIYDIPGRRATTGRQLTEDLLEQIRPFETPMLCGQTVSGLAWDADAGLFTVITDRPQTIQARAVVIAAGVGAFMPKRLALNGLDAWEGRQVHYRTVPQQVLQDGPVVVVGGDEAALELALDLSQRGPQGSVTLVHRTDRFKVDPALEQAVRSQIASGSLRLHIGQPVGFQADANTGRLIALECIDTDDRVVELPTAHLLPRLGLHPQLGPIADWHLALERKHLPVDTERFETGHPGIFAVGDINTYPGKRKLIVCGFHEATLAAFAIVQRLRPHERVLLQYTTTSTQLHQRLRVTPGGDTAPAHGRDSTGHAPGR